MTRVPRERAKTAPSEHRWTARPRYVILAAVLVLSALLIMVELMRITANTNSLEAVGGFIRSLGWSGVPVYIALFIVGSFLFVSAAALSVIAPILFGPWLGFFAILVANVAAAVLMFGAARWIERRWDLFRHLRGKLPEGLLRLARGKGLLVVFYARLILLPASAVNYAASLLPVSWFEMFWGTTLAVLPHALATALSVGLVRDAVLAGSWSALLRWETVLLLLVYGATLWGIHHIRRRMKPAG